jgi:hypothetical protein
MEWYEILGFVIVWFSGLYLRGKFHEWLKDYYLGGKWSKRK